MAWDLNQINAAFMNNLPNAGAAFQEGRDEFAQRQMLAAKAQEQQRQMQAARIREEQKQALIQEAIRNPSAAAFANLQTMFPEDREAFKSAWDIRSKDEQQAELGQLSSIRGYLANGFPDRAKAVLRRRIDAEKAAGNPVTEYEDMIAAIDENPANAAGVTSYMIAQIVGPDKYADTLGTIGEDEREAAKLPGEVAKTAAEASKAQVEAEYAPQTIESDLATQASNRQRAAAQTANEIARLKLDWEKLALDQDALETNTQIKLDEMRQKGLEVTGASLDQLTKSVGTAQANAALAERADSLADRIEESGARGGIGSNWAEGLKRITNNQDAVSALRGEYQRTVNSSVVANLPPGAASDRDIMIAREGFPPATADPKYVASFLRGMAKIQRSTALGEQRKADWISANGNLGTAKRDINVGGVNVPAGTTFGEFNGNAVKRGQAAAPERSYLDKWGNFQAPASVRKR